MGYRDRQEYDRAIKDLNSAVKLDPQFVAAYLNRGDLHAERKEYQRALEDFSSAIRIKSDYADAYTNRVLQLTTGAIDLAIADFDRALSLDQTNFAPYFNRAIVRRRSCSVRRLRITRHLRSTPGISTAISPAGSFMSRPPRSNLPSGITSGPASWGARPAATRHLSRSE